MKAVDVLMHTTKYAQLYRKEANESIQRNNHMNDIKSGEQLDQRHIDAVLVDFINFIGMKHGIDFALYVEDLKVNKEIDTTDYGFGNE